jgi:hypothetical protein
LVPAAPLVTTLIAIVAALVTTFSAIVATFVTPLHPGSLCFGIGCRNCEAQGAYCQQSSKTNHAPPNQKTSVLRSRR